MIHAAINVIGIREDTVTGNAFNIGDEPNPAGIAFLGRIIQTHCVWEANFTVESVYHLLYHQFDCRII